MVNVERFQQKFLSENPNAKQWDGNSVKVQKGDSVSALLFGNDELLNKYKEKAGSDNLFDVLNTAVQDLTINGKKVADNDKDGQITWKDAQLIRPDEELVFGAQAPKASEDTGDQVTLNPRQAQEESMDKYNNYLKDTARKALKALGLKDEKNDSILGKKEEQPATSDKPVVLAPPKNVQDIIEADKIAALKEQHPNLANFIDKLVQDGTTISVIIDMVKNPDQSEDQAPAFDHYKALKNYEGII